MVELNETLERLSRSFVTADIMTPSDKLICGKDVEHGKKLLEKHEQYDIIPIREKDRIASFVNRESPLRPESIQIQHIIGRETPILDLIDALTEKKFAFVIGQRRVIGLVHFSDLNDPIVKVPLFVLLEQLERTMADQIKGLVIEDNLSEVIKDPKRRETMTGKMKRLKEKAADRDWTTTFYFKEILEAAVWFKKTSVGQKDIDNLADVRDRVCHAASKKELVEAHADIRRLKKARDICLSILGPTPANN